MRQKFSKILKHHEASEIGSKSATTALEFCRELVGDLQQLTEELESEFIQIFPSCAFSKPQLDLPTYY